MGTTQDDHIEKLARGGLATHVIANPDTVDKVFSVATVQNMREVNFAAAFPDGTLVLGCPDGLPAQLADRATPIALVPHSEAPAPGDPDDLEPGAGEIEENTLSHRLDAIDDALKKVGALDVSRIAASLDDLHEYLATVGAGGADDGAENARETKVALSGVISEMRASMDEAVARLEARETTEAVLSAIDALGDRVTALADREFEPVTNDLPPEVAARLSALAGVEPKLNALAAQVAVLAKSSKPEPPHAVLAALSQIQAHLEAQGGEDAASGTDLLQDTLRGFGDTVAQMSQAISALSEAQDAGRSESAAPDLSRLEGMLGAMQSEQAAANGRLAELAEAIATSSAHPAPVLDLAPQRKSLAHFATVLNAAVTRLETAVGELAQAQPQSDVSDQGFDIKPEIEALRQELQSGIAAPQAELEALRASVEALSARPAPMPDLTLQRQSFAQFGTAMSAVVRRLEEVADGLGRAGLAPVEAADIADASAPEEQAASAEEDFGAASAEEAETTDAAHDEPGSDSSVPLAAAEHDADAPAAPDGVLDAHDPLALADLRAVLAETLAREMQKRFEARRSMNGAAREDA